MAGSNNFKVFDETQTNIMDDSAYNESTYRKNGAVSGIAPSNVHNKLYRQTSVMAAALAQAMANKGYTVSDANFDNLVTVLDNIMTDIADNSVTDAKIGNRTITDTTTAVTGANTLTKLLSMLGNMVKQITGKSNWYTAPATTLQTLSDLIVDTAAANKLLKLNPSGQLPASITGNAATATTATTAATATNATNHIAASSGAHAASAISSTPTGNISSTNVQSAIAELEAEKAPNSHASTATTYGVSTAAIYGHAMASSAAPLINGIATAGTDNGKFAREGHVHPAQTAITGNAATATRLATARTITATGDVSWTVTFDGNGNVSAIATVADDSHNHIIANVDGLQAALDGIKGSRVWVSGEYTPIQNTPTVVNHGISGLDPLYAQGEVMLRCVVAELGYDVGDYAIGWLGSSSGNSRGVSATLSSSTIQYNTVGTITAINKTTPSSGSAITFANWRYVFRIWY